MGWCSEYVYGEKKLQQLLEKLCNFEDKNFTYSLVDYAPIGFNGAVGIMKGVCKQSLKESFDCFGILTQFGTSEVMYKTVTGPDVAKCCPKKLMPLLKKCHGKGDVEYYNKSKEEWEKSKSAISYKEGEYYYNEQGIELTNGYTTKLWRVQERKVVCVRHNVSLPPAKKRAIRNKTHRVERRLDKVKLWLSANIAFTKVECGGLNGMLLKVVDPKSAYKDAGCVADISPFLTTYKKYYGKYNGPQYLFIRNADFQSMGLSYTSVDEMANRWRDELNKRSKEVNWEKNIGKPVINRSEMQLDMFGNL